jgi:cytochrome c6
MGTSALEVDMKFFTACVALSAALAFGPQAASAQAADGAAVFKANCAKCHGREGVPPKFALRRYKNLVSLADPATLKGISVDSTMTVIANGKGKDMKPFEGKLTPAEIAAVAKYVFELAKPAGHR